MLEKARILVDQSRYGDAEKEIARVLVEEPENDAAHALLARIKIDQGKAGEALEPIIRALQLNPEEEYYLYLKAFAHYKLDQHQATMELLQDAIGMNPYMPAYYALFAYVLIDERRFAEALQKANEGLQVDAEDIGCLNARSRALNKMGKVDDAIATMQDSLAVDPENDFTHVTVAWNFLEKGQHRQAAHHFKEALRINPANVTARNGLKEALKSRIAPYRWFLQYGIWLSNKGRAARIGFTVGLYICFRLAALLGSVVGPPWSYLVGFIIIAYLLFVVTSWLIEPVANFFLIYHPEGKYALTQSEKVSSQTVIAALLAGMVFFVLFLTTKDKDLNGDYLVATLIVATLPFAFSRIDYPLSNTFKTRRSSLSASLALLGILSLVGIFTINAWGVGLFVVYIILLAIGTWTSALRRK